MLVLIRFVVARLSPLVQFPIYRFPVFLSYVAITIIMMMMGDKTVEAELV